MKASIDVTTSASALASANTATPAVSTGRRPKRSDSGPATSCATPNAAMNSVSVCCARSASVANAAGSDGSDAR